MMVRFRELLTEARWGQRALPRRGGRGATALPYVLSVALGLSAMAAEVHVYERTLAGGVATQLGDTTTDTLTTYSTRTAPAISGYIFTHWTTTASQTLADRDRLGRAKDAVSATIYEETTFTANYFPASQDTDGDGMADGYEIYWYGSLAFSPDSDTDNDGFSFAEELAAGTDPLMPDRSLVGGIVWADGNLLQYNPSNLWPYVIRSEPEGALFATISDYVEPGTAVSTASYSPTSSNFAYWMVDGVRQSDRHGRAKDSIIFLMSSNAIELVAVCESDSQRRNGLYWYGNANASADSDTDNDGFTFAEELAAGTDPLMPDRSLTGGIVWADGDLLQYNINNLWPYVIRSKPEGALFATLSDYVEPGTTVSTASYCPSSSNFAYWMVDGVRQADRHGRAKDSITFSMPSNAIEVVAVCEGDSQRRSGLYWYGNADASADSDTDHDGFTFAEELAAGTDPLMPDRSLVGGIVWADGNLLETDLQVYEQVIGAIVDDQFKHFFTSPIAGNEARSETFGEDLQPVVWDLNGDGLFDLVLVYKGGYKTFINVGYHGNPEFEERRDVPTNSVDLAVNDLAKLGALELDVQPVEALSATTNGAVLLVSDSAGRIWYYLRRVEDAAPYQLQHKVWGGSHAGFAEGLRLAAVDWDEDGDLDCLAGTAGGKLMLLRDPKVGRPTGLKAEAGIDTVVLSWDPNRQSRIRGYKVYCGNADEESYDNIASPQLPTYRDYPNGRDARSPSDSYDYKVSSVSRFYTAGNSTPTITESPATEAVRATLGGVKFNWLDVNTKVGERVEVVIAIENALNYDVAGKSQSVSYDPQYLRPVEVLKSGLTENIVMVDDGLAPSSSGCWSVTMTSGILPAGSGRFLTFVFEALKEGTTTVGGATGDRATVVIAARSEIAAYRLGDVNGDGELTKADAQLLARLKNGAGQHPTPDQIKAGDFNGNGKLDNADYQALRALLKDKGVL